MNIKNMNISNRDNILDPSYPSSAILPSAPRYGSLRRGSSGGTGESGPLGTRLERYGYTTGTTAATAQRKYYAFGMRRGTASGPADAQVDIGPSENLNSSRVNINLSEQHTYSEPLYISQNPMQVYLDNRNSMQRQSSHNNLNGTLPRYTSNLNSSSATTAISSNNGNSSNSTTGPMVPLPNNLHSQHMIDSSNPPPLLLRAGTGTLRGPGGHLGHHHESRGSFLDSVTSRLGIGLGKSCSAGGCHESTWKVTTLALVILCLILMSVVAYKEASRLQLTYSADDTKPCIIVEGDSQSQTPLPPDNNNGGLILLPSASGANGQHHYGHGRSTDSSLSVAGGQGSQHHGGHRSRPESLSSCFAINLPRNPTAFPEIELSTSPSSPLSTSLEGFASWSGSFVQPASGFLRFHFLGLPPWARLAVLAAKNEPPSITQHDLLELINPNKHNSATGKFKKRDSDPRDSVRSGVSVELLDFFEAGSWYITIINDGQESVPLVMNISNAADIRTHCANDCHGHGKCHLGKCQCFPGYIGHDCADSVCPVVCSGHGRYQNGRCACETAWKGPECSTRATECEVSDCNGHGKCISGTCQCHGGYKGDYCEDHDCPDTSCSGNGACLEGQCLCKTGWSGKNCSEIDVRVSKFFPDCSSRGVYDLDSQRCVCFSGWLGEDCSLAKCNLDCGPNGVCEGSSCVCSEGWEGLRCERKRCDVRCLDHGQCRNGSCLCNTGWYGKHCTLNGCPSGCSGKGECSKSDSADGSDTWRCRCREGWTGKDCSHSLENNCADDIDNDNDGLFDCADSECCAKEVCRDSLMCLTSPDPLDILLRKPPPSVTASFYQKMKFLIEEGSVQSYAHRDEYSESRVSVIRGQVVTPDGNGLTGIRISVATDPQFGFTLTRPDGWFDILVNGGSMITLQFQRSPFHPIKRTIMVPWNEIIVIQVPITMSATSEESYAGPDGSTMMASMMDLLDETGPPGTATHRPNRTTCPAHDYYVLKPVLFYNKLPVLQETLPVPGSGVKLMYQSSSSPGYLSTINLQLTNDKIATALKLVHLRIVVEGNLFSKLFEAEANIKFTYAWNKRNVYRQKVYGLATARVYVGYEYVNCLTTIWTTLTTTLRGFDMEISELGSWNLDIHHRYNYHQAVLQKGDGSIIYFRQQPRVVTTLIGQSGETRKLVCPSQECDGPARASKLMSPISLTSGPDGSVYVGDGNLIRRITPEGYVFTIYKSSDKSNSRGKGPSSSGSQGSLVNYNYHILLSPYDGHLYISDPERHQIVRLHSLSRVENTESNFDVFVGSGSRCLPRDSGRCGDDGSALDARLSFPKGMAFGLDGSLYFADGHSIRMVSSRGIIQTIIGSSNDHPRHGGQWKPIPCGRSLPADELKLRWPTELTIHPVDGSLYFLDDQMVFRLTPDHRVMVTVGSPSYCKYSQQSNDKINGQDYGSATDGQSGDDHDIGIVVSFAFSPSGDMYVAAVGQDGVNRVSLVGQDGRWAHFMGIQRRPSLYGMAKCEIETCKDISAKNCTCAVSMVTSNFGETSSSVLTPDRSTLKELTDFFINQDSNGGQGGPQGPVRMARETPLVSVTSITVTADGVVHVADEGAVSILSAVPFIPSPDESMQFTMASTETNELYIFNKYGQQVLTKNTRTGQVLYSFLYDVNTSFGKLSAVQDSSGSRVSFLRDSSKALYSVETSAGYVCRVSVNNQNLLEQFIDADTLSTRFYYEPETGLLKRRSDSSGFSLFYEYDANGRLVGVI
ncbi:Teneurin-m [Halotydeus destructor]|nr:Teneurin-m [Halotydeus destructor]